MSSLLISLFFVVIILLLSVRSTVILGYDDDDDNDFFKQCPPSRCSRDGPEVRFPLRLHSSPTSCGLAELSCSGNQTILSLPYPGPYMVLAIDYRHQSMTIKPLRSLQQHPCPFRNLSSSTNPAGFRMYYNYIAVILVSCSERLAPTSGEEEGFAGPISCLSGAGADHLVYAAKPYLSMDSLPLECMVVSTLGMIPSLYSYDTFRGSVEAFDQRLRRTLQLGWHYYSSEDNCQFCEANGKHCGLNQPGNQIICSTTTFGPFGHQGSNVKLIAGTSIGGFLILLFVALILLYKSRKSDKEKETRLKVEKFLAMYKATNPTRYTYASIKRITKGFKHKLGQGGFGSVYKGELLNGIPVAVKMLEKSKGDGEEFTNEVATIGRIHHSNIVRLLGFCSEGSRHALVYEFLPNESLEKFIFSKEVGRTCLPLSLEKLQEITLGIAQGIEYLHQGCNERILHFDIKPHNILLDHDFNPKISDFGLAKLCSRDDSIVTMTAARGTMGYIAPEIYSRNFGIVSYKSDVYSFGMLLLEMVSGKKNVEPAIENQDEVYFPEWVYDRLVDEQDLGLTTDAKGGEEEIAKKLVVVALWCIQWNPIERPSMTKVIHMLMGNLESLQMPPKPFVSSSSQDNNTYLNVI